MMNGSARRWIGRIGPPLFLVVATGCAYFNTFYLARKNFRQAESTVAKSTTDKVPADAVRGYEIAITQSRKVIDRYPKSRWADDAVYVLSASYYGKGDYDSAMIRVNDLERLYPKSELVPDGIHLSGLIEWKRRNFDEAVARLDRVLAEYPNYRKRDEVLFALANIAADRQDRAGAIAGYMRLAQTYPKSARVQDALQRSGQIYLDEGKFDSAAVAFGHLLPQIRDDRRRIDVAVLQAQALTRLGRGDESLDIVRGLMPKEATTPLAPVANQTTNPQGANSNFNTNQDETKNTNSNTNYDDRNADELNQSTRNQTSNVQTPATTLSPASQDDVCRLRLQEAAALNQMGKSEDALSVLKDVTTRFQSSNYAVEAQFQIGYTYETLLDSLEAARSAYERVGSLPGRSVFKEQALQRADALKSQIQLEKQAQAGDAAAEARAAAALRIAEILLLDRDRVDEALAQYGKVEEEFPDSRAAPRAGYARAYIRWKKQADSLGAQGEFRNLVSRYPSTTVARSAIRLLASQGADTLGLHALLRAVVPDTLPEQTDSLAARPDSIPGMEPERLDSLGVGPGLDKIPPDSLGRPPMDLPRRGSAPPRHFEEREKLHGTPGDSSGSTGVSAPPGMSTPPDISSPPGESTPQETPAPPDSSTSSPGDGRAPQGQGPPGVPGAGNDAGPPDTTAAPADTTTTNTNAPQQEGKTP